MNLLQMWILLSSWKCVQSQTEWQNRYWGYSPIQYYQTPSYTYQRQGQPSYPYAQMPQYRANEESPRYAQQFRTHTNGYHQNRVFGIPTLSGYQRPDGAFQYRNRYQPQNRLEYHFGRAGGRVNFSLNSIRPDHAKVLPEKPQKPHQLNKITEKTPVKTRNGSLFTESQSTQGKLLTDILDGWNKINSSRSYKLFRGKGQPQYQANDTNNKTLDDEHDLFGKIGVWSMKKLTVQQNVTNTTSDDQTSNEGNKTLKQSALEVSHHDNLRKELFDSGNDNENTKLEILSGTRTDEQNSFLQISNKNTSKWNNLTGDSLITGAEFSNNKSYGLGVESNLDQSQLVMTLDRMDNMTTDFGASGLNNQSEAILIKNNTSQGDEKDFRPDFGTSDTGLSFRLEDLKFSSTNSSDSDNTSLAFSSKLEDNLVKESNSMVIGKVETITPLGTCGKAFQMTGGGYIEVYTKNLKNLPKMAMAFATWVRLRRTDRMNVIYSSNSEKGIHHNMEIRSKKPPVGSPNGSIRWMVRASGANTVFLLQTDSVVPSGIWTHLTAVYNGEQGVAAIYINGVKMMKEEEDKSVIPWGTSILLGSVKSTLTGNVAGHLEGDLARTKLFNRQLSTSEISSLAKECEFGIGETSYFFSVCTGDEFTAGSPSKVFVALSGSKGQFGEIKLGKDFSSGYSQLIELHGPDVGEIELLSIRKDKSGLIAKSWHLKKVEITMGDRETGTTFIFPCDCWFKGDKLQHHLKSGNQAKGGWAPWSDWSGCGSGMCGGDRKVRTRACTNPVPLNGVGRQCRKADGSFDNFEAEVQPCPVDGGWGAWSSWTECSKTCDGALVTRVRKCDNPAPANNGKTCEGKKSETKKDCARPCNMAPVDGQWSPWSDWSACAQTCGGSVVTRTRSCNNPKPAFGGRECPGNDTETAEDCLNPCPVDGGFGEWSMWGECSKTCGQGVKVRTHDCNRPLPVFGGKNCTGPWTEEAPCKIKECPNSINGAWGAWGGWSVCTEKIYCNKGVMRRSRKCDNPAPKNGGDLCPGLNSEEKVCPTANCKVKGLDEVDKKKVDPKSFISLTCNANEAFHTQGTHANEIPQSIYNKYYAVVAKSLKTGYFARTVKKQDNQDIALFCFEPSEMPTVGQMQKEFPAFKLVPSLPDYNKPNEDVKVPGIAVGLKSDLTLYSGEFVLGESQAYTAFKSGQSSLSLSDARFLYQEKPGFRGIVAYGKEQFANAMFDLEITLGPSATGSTNSSTNAAEIVKSMALPTASTFIPSSFSGAGDAFLKFILDYLVELGLTRVPATMVTETASESDGTLTRRITGTIPSSEGLGLFTMEIIKQVEFAVGFTTGKTQFATLTQKLFKKKLNLFGQMRDASVGIAFATKNFKVTSETGFSSEPLKSAITTAVPAGLVLAAQCKMPEDCSRDTFCKLAQLIIGKDTVLYFNGNINLKGFKIAAGIKDRKITEKVKFSTIELFVSMQIPDITVSFGFKVAIEFPVKGEIYKNNILQPISSITLSGKLEFNGVSVTGVLSMEGMWRKIFGVSYIAIGQLTLGLTITLSGIPTALQFEGRLELGNDCYFPEDFKNEGQCISQHAKVGINPTKPQDFFIYADLSPVTLGKILRMLGSKLTLPSPVESAGFPEGLTVSGALSDQQITFNDQVKTVKKGIFIKGKVNLFGLAFALTLQLSDKNILCETGLDPINLANSVVITRSLTDKTKGPIFKLSAARDPLAFEVYVEGAVKIFGVETAILFNLTKEQIEAALSLNLFNKLNAKLSITAGYGESLEKTGFTAKFLINTGFDEVEEGTSKDVQTLMQKGRENLQQAQQILKESSDECRKKTTTYCSLCQSITCEQITENCKLAMDKFKHYIGGSVNRFGGWFVDVAKEIASHFRARDRRYIEFFPGRAQLMTRLRRKRFVGKVLCENIAPAMCKGARILCEGSCSITKHVTKGVCWGLDKAQVLLHRVENTTYWVKKAAQVLQENMLVIHSLGFEVALSPSVLSKVAATVDLTFFKTRQQFSLELSVQSLKENAKKIADLAIAGFSEIYQTRLSDPIYDPPSVAADYALSGTFRIENKETKVCLSIPDLRPGADIKIAVCLEDSSRWTYTLTGQIMNIQSGLCLSAKDKEGAKLQQLDCKIGGNDQNFTCEENKLRLAGTDLCITEEGVEKVTILKSCEDKDSQKIQEWGIKGDPRKIVCDEFVPDIALGKPTTQSSNFQFADIGKTDYINPEDKNAVFYKVGPELAVDGDMSAFLKDGSCSHTRQEQDPWWRVDLLQEHIVTDVSVVSPYGGVKVEPLANFEIRVGVSKTFARNPMCGGRVGQLHYGEVWTSKCDPPLSGQYVSVQRFGNVFMTICEVAVFSRLDNQGKCTKELRRKRREISEGQEDLDTP